MTSLLVSRKPGFIALQEKLNFKRHETAFSKWIDLFRWLAAFEVLLFHARHRLLDHLSDTASLFDRVIYTSFAALTSFGNPAVIVFFVLSGYLVGGATLEKYKLTRSFSFSEYFISRLIRLWIVLIPVIALTYVLVEIGRALPLVGSFEIYNPKLLIDSSTLICNILFMQTALCPQFGDNGALWSLFNEFWYYIAWPFIMVSIWGGNISYRRRFILLSFPITMLVFLSTLQFIGSNIAVYFSLWLLGVFASNTKTRLDRLHPYAAFAMFVATLIIWRMFSSSEVQGTNIFRELPFDMFVAASFGILLICAKSYKALPMPPLANLHTVFASFSFTLYCVHTPLIHFLAALSVASTGSGWQMSPTGLLPYAYFICVILLCIGFAWFLSQLTEKHTYKVREEVLNDFHRARVRTHRLEPEQDGSCESDGGEEGIRTLDTVSRIRP